MSLYPTERKLLRKYGRTRHLPFAISALFIADTHGSLWEKEEELSEAVSKPYDLCFLLGDHEFDDIDVVLGYVPKEKLYGVLGNHDMDWISKFGIQDLHGKILGCGGSYRYKSGKYPSFTQAESVRFFYEMPPADILISHDGGCDECRKKKLDLGTAHMGLFGITEYCFRNRVSLHIHGHNHDSFRYEWVNGTTEYCLDKCEIRKQRL